MINFLPHLNFIYEAHSSDMSKKSKRVRLWDKQTPYAIHPIWCATTLLTETTLPEEIRENGALALLYHDILEDTSADLPVDVSDEVASYIHAMTFEKGFEQEKKELFKQNDDVLLLKLYDKTSNLLDGSWMTPDFYMEYHTFTGKLAKKVTSKYSDLNIVRIFNGLDKKREA